MRSKENWMIHFRKSKAKVFHCFQTPSWVQFLSITLKGITKIPLYKCFSYYSMNMLSTGCDCLNNPIDGTNNTPFFIILTCPLYYKWCKMPLFFIIFIYHIWLNFNIRCHSIMIVFIIKLRDINHVTPQNHNQIKVYLIWIIHKNIK